MSEELCEYQNFHDKPNSNELIDWLRFFNTQNDTSICFDRMSSSYCSRFQSNADTWSGKRYVSRAVEWDSESEKGDTIYTWVPGWRRAMKDTNINYACRLIDIDRFHCTVPLSVKVWNPHRASFIEKTNHLTWFDNLLHAKNWMYLQVVLQRRALPSRFPSVSAELRLLFDGLAQVTGSCEVWLLIDKPVNQSLSASLIQTRQVDLP